MSEGKEKIFRLKSIYSIFALSGFIIILICFIGLFMLTLWGGVLNYIDMGKILAGAFIYLIFYFHYARLKIIVTAEAIQNVQFLPSPFSAGNKLAKKILWKDVKELKIKKEFTGGGYYYVKDENGRFIFFWTRVLENSSELIDYIENKTGKKFEPVK